MWTERLRVAVQAKDKVFFIVEIIRVDALAAIPAEQARLERRAWRPVDEAVKPGTKDKNHLVDERRLCRDL